MNNWFTVKVKYTKQLENGTFKRVTEPYLLASMTFTDAEARIYDELGSVIRGEFNVVGIARTEIHDIFAYDDTDTWYKVKVAYERVDGEGEMESKKKVSQNFLVSAHNVKEAYERIQESLSTLLVDFTIPSIIVSPIVEIFPYTENLDKEISRRPIEDLEEDLTHKSSKVFSAPGSDIDEEDEFVDEDGAVSELTDEYSDED